MSLRAIFSVALRAPALSRLIWGPTPKWIRGSPPRGQGPYGLPAQACLRHAQRLRRYTTPLWPLAGGAALTCPLNRGGAFAPIPRLAIPYLRNARSLRSSSGLRPRLAGAPSPLSWGPIPRRISASPATLRSACSGLRPRRQPLVTEV